MANDSSNVFAAKPAAIGAIWAAPSGTTAPTDATTALGGSFVCLGYVSEDGINQSIETDSEDFGAYGGDIVANFQTSRSEEFQFTLIEQNVEAMKQAYGETNVTGTWDSGITIKHNGIEKSEYVYVIETLLGKTKVDRTVIPRGKVIELGDVVRKDDELMGYELTVRALPDGEANTAYDYFAKIAATGTTGTTGTTN